MRWPSKLDFPVFPSGVISQHSKRHGKYTKITIKILKIYKNISLTKHDHNRISSYGIAIKRTTWTFLLWIKWWKVSLAPSQRTHNSISIIIRKAKSALIEHTHTYIYLIREHDRTYSARIRVLYVNTDVELGPHYEHHIFSLYENCVR